MKCAMSSYHEDKALTEAMMKEYKAYMSDTE